MTYQPQNQQPFDVKRMIIAMAASLIILFGWQYFFAAMPPAAQPGAEGQAQSPSGAQAELDVDGLEIPGTGSPSSGGAAGDIAVPDGLLGAQGQFSRSEAIERSERVKIETDAYQGSINLTGARLDDLSLTDYREDLDPSSDLVHLFSPLGAPQPYYFDYNLRGHKNIGFDLPGAETKWEIESGSVLKPGSPVTLRYDGGEDVVFHKTFSVDDRYLITVSMEVENKRADAITLFPVGGVRLYQVNREDGFRVGASIIVLHEGVFAYDGKEDKLVEISFGDLIEDRTEINGSIDSWIGLTTKYWTAAMIPGKEVNALLYQTGSETEPVYRAEYVEAKPLVIAPSSTGKAETKLFAGAKEVALVDRYAEELDLPSFEYIIDWGILYYLTRPMFYLLNLIYSFVGNFGIAILGVTVVVKAIFFPIANKSYVSMTMMKKLQPKVKKIQEAHKDDKVKSQQEIMQLYKKEKVNPLSGCLPVLLQIPVFFALYKVLYVTIEMRHAPFFGWINDLAVPDPTSVFNLFGLLPFTPPAFLAIGIWPLIMGITMFFQMKMNPPPPDPIQAKVFTFMPIFFTFLLASFPAGLVIYWTWNNSLSILQQSVIMRRLGVKIELWDNLKAMFGRGEKET